MFDTVAIIIKACSKLKVFEASQIFLKYQAICFSKLKYINPNDDNKNFISFANYLKVLIGYICLEFNFLI